MKPVYQFIRYNDTLCFNLVVSACKQKHFLVSSQKVKVQRNKQSASICIALGLDGKCSSRLYYCVGGMEYVTFIDREIK